MQNELPEDVKRKIEASSVNIVKIEDRVVTKSSGSGCVVSFGGHTQGIIKADDSISKDVLIRLTEYRRCYEMTYEGKVGDFHAFKLPGEHPGHDYFNGCSGAPIIDVDGNVVALVTEGSISEKRIYGVPIETYLLTLMAPYLVERFARTGDTCLPENLRAFFMPAET